MLTTDVDRLEVIERVRQTITGLKTRMLVSLDDPAQWQDEFGQAIANFGDLLAKFITVICIAVWVINFNNFSDSSWRVPQGCYLLFQDRCCPRCRCYS